MQNITYIRWYVNWGMIAQWSQWVQSPPVPYYLITLHSFCVLRPIAMSTCPDRAQSVSADEMSDDISEEKNEQCTFCSQEHQDNIVHMMEHHYNSHPLIPGHCHPRKEGIKYWAVKQIFSYCVKHNLWEL